MRNGYESIAFASTAASFMMIDVKITKMTTPATTTKATTAKTNTSNKPKATATAKPCVAYGKQPY